MPFSAEFEQKYAIQRVLGEGGMSRVYLARERGLERLVAIKFIQVHGGIAEGLADRLLEEARVCAAIKHPNVVRVYGYGLEPGAPFVVFEFVEGYTLSQELRARGALPLERVAPLFRAILSGLDAAHELGIVHRDLKPGNILLRRDSGEPMLMDFGVAKASGGRQVTTQAGMLLGTPAYMAPELIMGEEVTRAADIYSLGVMLFECLAGHGPFQAGNDVQLLAMHVHDAPPALSSRAAHVPEVLSRLVARALAKKPAERYDGARAMLSALDELLTASGSRVLVQPAMLAAVGAAPVASTPTRALSLVPVERPASVQRTRPVDLKHTRGSAAPSRRRQLPLWIALALVPAGLVAGALAWLADGSASGVRVTADDDGRVVAEWGTRHAGRGGLAVRPRAVPGSTQTSYDAADVVQHRAALAALPPGPYGVAILSPDGGQLWSDTVAVPEHGAAHARPVEGGAWEVTAPAGAFTEGYLEVPGAAAATRSAGVREGQLWFPCRFPDAGPPPGTAVVLAPQPEVRVRYRVDRARDVARELEARLAGLPIERLAGEISRLRDFTDAVEFHRRGAVLPPERARIEAALTERLKRERVADALDAFREWADRFFTSGEDALARALYLRLLDLEMLQGLVIAQHEMVAVPVRDLYRRYVSIEHVPHWLEAPAPAPNAIKLLPAPRFMVTEDYESWMAFNFWVAEHPMVAELVGVMTIDPTELRLSSSRPLRSAGPELERLAGERAVTLRAVVAFLAPGYALRVRFRGASGETFPVLLTHPGTAEWFAAMDGRQPASGPQRKAGEEHVYWGEVRATFPARLLPHAPLSVEITNEHVPGVKVSDLSYPMNRAVLVRDLTVE